MFFGDDLAWQSSFLVNKIHTGCPKKVAFLNGYNFLVKSAVKMVSTRFELMYNCLQASMVLIFHLAPCQVLYSVDSENENVYSENHFLTTVAAYRKCWHFYVALKVTCQVWDVLSLFSIVQTLYSVVNFLNSTWPNFDLLFHVF